MYFTSLPTHGALHVTQDGATIISVDDALVDLGICAEFVSRAVEEGDGYKSIICKMR